MINQNCSITLKNKVFSIEFFFVICVSCSWVFALAVKKWMSASLFLTAAIALLILAKNKKNAIPFLQENKAKKSLMWSSIALASPLLAISLGQLFRQDFYAAGYDSSFRFFLAIPILYAIINNKIDTLKYLEYAIPSAIFMTLLSFLIKPSDRWTAVDRFSTYFVDPLAFGSICLTLALMSLISINLYKNDSVQLKLFKLTSFATGIYLSIVSGSRTGWAAIPLVLLLWVYIKFSGKHLLIALISLLFFIKILFFIPTVQQRTDIAINEIINYQWSGLNPDTSVGLRISFIRIGLFLFSHNLFAGWGDTGFKEVLNTPKNFPFASVSAKEVLSIAGFHNEIMANMVRSGIWGFISSTSIFLVPAFFFIKGLCSTSIIIRNCALVAMSYLICVFITGITTEVFSSKLTVSFYAIIMVNLIGSLFVMMSSDQQTTNYES